MLEHLIGHKPSSHLQQFASNLSLINGWSKIAKISHFHVLEQINNNGIIYHQLLTQTALDKSV